MIEDLKCPFNFGMKHLYLPWSSNVTLVIFSDMLPRVRPSANSSVLWTYSAIFMSRSSRASRYRWTYSTRRRRSLGSGWRSGLDHSTVRPVTSIWGSTWHGRMMSSPGAATIGWSDPITLKFPEKWKKTLTWTRHFSPTNLQQLHDFVYKMPPEWCL